METIDSIVQEAASRVKKILLDEAKKIAKFPTTPLGVRSKNPETHFHEEWLHTISSPDTGIKGKTEEKHGIEVYVNDKIAHFSKRFHIFMMPDGLYKLSCAMVETRFDPDYTARSYPDWTLRQEFPENYLVYGEMALERIRKVIKRQTVKA